MGPGWEPGKPRLGNIEDIPDVSSSLIIMNLGMIFMGAWQTKA